MQIETGFEKIVTPMRKVGNETNINFLVMGFGKSKMAFLAGKGSSTAQFLWSPKPTRPFLELSDLGIVIPSMNTLEILRETIRILCHDCSVFMMILFMLICPVSGVLLSNVLVNQHVMRSLSRRLMLVAASSGLPLTHFVKQMCQYLSGTVLSSAFCFPLLLIAELLAKASIAYSVACSYAGKRVEVGEFLGLVCKIRKRLVLTYLWVCVAIMSCLAIFFVMIVLVCNTFSMVGCHSEVIIYPALLILLASSMVYVHTVIICNLASVISVLEDKSGLEVLFTSVHLIRGQTQVGLLIFFGSTIGMGFVKGLFEHMVKSLGYGDGSSRIWEGPLLVIMYSFVVLIDSMMSVIFYFTCRSSSLE